MRKTTPLAFFLFITLFITPTAAVAHASVLSSNPSEGQVITEMPKEISVTFSDELLVVAGKEINTLKLNHSDGTSVPLQDATVTSNVLTAAVIAGENQPGLYQITYRAISTDGHEVSDLITFSLNTPQGVVVTSEAIEVGTSGAIPLPIALTFALLIAIAGFVLFERRRSSK
jgi:methionine-rich copper-binding protein CopC